MHTEEQARKLWCPWARVALEWLGKDMDPTRPMGPPNDQRMLAASVNRGDALSAKTLCLASECGVWRWWGEVNDSLVETARELYADLPDPQPPLKDTEIWQDYCDARVGFCGRGGNPQ